MLEMNKVKALAKSFKKYRNCREKLGLVLLHPLLHRHKMKIRKPICMIGFLILSSCHLFDNGSDQIIGKYEIMWIDTHNTRSIGERTGPTGSWTLVPQYVFAVGHNSDFIIAKQHPTSGFESGYEIDQTITNYFIIDIRSETKVLGPMDRLEFDKKVAALNLGGITFDQTYPEEIW